MFRLETNDASTQRVIQYKISSWVSPVHACNCCVCVPARTRVCVGACMCVCSMGVCVRVCVCVRACACACDCECTRAHVYVYVCVYPSKDVHHLSELSGYNTVRYPTSTMTICRINTTGPKNKAPMVGFAGGLARDGRSGAECGHAFPVR
jgi:hypothetical protein